MKRGGGFQSRPPQQRREDTHTNKGEKAIQAESNYQLSYCSGEEKDSTWFENEETVNLALVAEFDSEVSHQQI